MIDYRASERAITRFAFRVGRRLAAAGAPMHLIDDVKQELWVAWCKARDGYDPNAGASFNTYLFNGMQRHINRWVTNNVSKRHGEVVALSLERELGEEGDGGSLLDILPNGDPLPDEIVANEDHWLAAMRRLPPRARLFMELLRDPPESLVREVRLIEAKANYARSNGISMPFSNRVTSAMIFNAMNISRPERTRIAAEIRKVGMDLQRVGL